MVELHLILNISSEAYSPAIIRHNPETSSMEESP